ncbi:YceK/YidQ family lipoprotein [Enterobacter cloacae complex sp. I2]|uniref:YceK/YidQ family lipoprotein n=1 Tax=Enterobacter cloacae complex sp. I2 TaxID=2779603 RepID=UPI0018690D94|nr:YceK/YidQ family lipoprotein [Enterobacter cloacae complex sp. I2]MBE3513572.1 YceK/YidQ family lipoprotein [Enterobacter cloacae complex sp. I2]
MMRNVLIKLATFSGAVLLCGCSSVMSHTGGKEGTYPGTRASAAMISDDETNWGTKSLAILDMPFTAVADTLLLPWDMFRTDSSVRSRVEKSEQETLATNSVIPPAEMPPR